MTTLDDLLETLENRAARTPVDTGLLPAVRGRAASLRRRRQIVRGTAVVAAVLVAAVTVPWATGRSRQHTPVTAPGRPASQTTITLRDSSKYQIVGRQSDTVAQYARVHGKGDGDGTQVLAFDPGAFDPATLQRGVPVEVGGPRAWYVASYATDPAATPTGQAIGWKDAATGSWVLVTGFSFEKKAGLVEVARDVRLGEGVEMLSPVSFEWVPDGLRTVQTSVDTGPGTPAASFGLGFGSERGTVGFLQFKGPALPLQFEATLKDEHKDWNNFEHDLLGLAPKVINGAQTWYLTRPNKVFTSQTAAGADMVVAAGNCQITLHVTDRSRISEGDLDRMLGSATFGDCADASGWRPPLL